MGSFDFVVDVVLGVCFGTVLGAIDLEVCFGVEVVGLDLIGVEVEVGGSLVCRLVDVRGVEVEVEVTFFGKEEVGVEGDSFFLKTTSVGVGVGVGVGAEDNGTKTIEGVEDEVVS